MQATGSASQKLNIDTSSPQTTRPSISRLGMRRNRETYL